MPEQRGPGVTRSALLVLRIARRMLRWRGAWAAAAVTGATALVLVVLFVTLSSLSLSSRQIVERDFGSFDKFAGFGTVAVSPGSLDAVEFLSARFDLDDGPERRFVSLSVDGLVVDGRTVGAREGEWRTTPFPRRYVLEAGRWPTAPGEVVITRGADGGVPAVGEEVPALSGALSLTVVGIAVDRYPMRTAGYLLGPGTYSSLDTETGDAFDALSAQPVVYWSGGGREAEQAVRDVLRAYAANSNNRFLGGFSNSVGERRLVAALRPRSWIEDNPAGYTIPSIGLPLLAVLLGALSLTGRAAHRTRTLVAVGITPGQAATVITVVIMVAMGAAALLGIIGGYVTSWLLRPVVAAVHDNPLSPVPGPFSPLSRIVLGLAAGSVLVLASMRLAGRDHAVGVGGRLDRTRGRWSGADWRQVAAAVAAALCLWRIPQTKTAEDAMWLLVTFAGLAALLTPDLLRCLRRLLSERRLDLRLARRMLEREPERSGALAGTVAALVATAVGFSAIISALLAAAGEAELPDVLEQQVLVVDRATPVVAPAPKSVSWVADQLDAGGAGAETQDVRLHFLTSGPLKEAERFVAMDGNSGYVIAVDSVQGAALAIGRELTTAESSTLQRGGMLDWRDDTTEVGIERPVQLVVTGQEATRVEGITAERPPADWSRGKDGLVLVATAKAQDLPVSAGAVLFAPVSDDDRAALTSAVDSAGIDPGTVQTFETVPAPVPPVAVRATTVALFGTVLLIAALEARVRASSLRRYSGALVSIGVDPRLIRRSFVTQQSLIFLAAFIGGVAAALCAVYLAGLFLGNKFEVQVAWRELTTLLAGVYAAGVVSLLLGLRTIRATPDTVGLE